MAPTSRAKCDVTITDGYDPGIPADTKFTNALRSGYLFKLNPSSVPHIKLTRLTEAGVKAVAEARQTAEMAAESFMVRILGSINVR